MKKLFKYDSKGKIREWSVKTEGDSYIVSHGLKDGKIQEKTTVCKAKNIGKSNETTPEEQALLEAKAKHVFQVVRDDYHEDVEKSGLQLRPMLAMDYRKVGHRVDWKRAWTQPKLDGLRLTAGNRWIDNSDHEMMTRKGDTYNVPHLMESTKMLLRIVNDICDKQGHSQCQALDGEAYIHGLPLQKITSLARKYRKGKTEQLKYYIFDLIIPDMGFGKRYNILVKALREFNKIDNDHFVLVPVDTATNEDQMKELHGKYLEQGYEGLMIRHHDAHYGYGKRSADLFKYKEFFDCEALIIDIWSDKNNNCMLTVQLKNGLECGVTPKRTHDARKEMLNQKDDLIGKWITVKYQALTDDGNLQFPVGLDIRECDAEGNPIV